MSPEINNWKVFFLKRSVLFNMIFPKMGLPGHPSFLSLMMNIGGNARDSGVLSIKTPTVDVPVENLSGGNQQKVVVGKWLPFDINVLLLADPARGLMSNQRLVSVYRESSARKEYECHSLCQR